MTEAPVMNCSTTECASFTLWEKLAAKSEDFGHPEKFVCDPVKTNWVSATITIRDYPELFRYIEEKTGNPTGKAGVTTFVKSSWFMRFNAALQPVDPDQLDDGRCCGCTVCTPMIRENM